MLIDLHCHTKKVKSGETNKLDLTNRVEVFKKKVESSGVECVAITNHNIFDYKQFNEIKDIMLDNFMLWPGVELDVSGTNSEGHIVLICSPNKIDEFNEFILDITKGSNPDSFKIDIQSLCDKSKHLDLIYIAHKHKKPELSKEDILYFKKELGDKQVRLLYEPTALSSIGVLHYKGEKAILGSDIKDWRKYNECTFGKLKYRISSFETFLKLIEKDKKIIHDLTDQKFKENVTVFGEFDSKKHPFKIPIYNDVNIIFGDKGSGKSEIIKSLFDYYKNMGQEPAFYEGSNKAGWYNKKICLTDEDYQLSAYNITNDIVDEMAYIKNFKDNVMVSCAPGRYLKYFKSQVKNKRKDSIKCLNIKPFLTIEKKRLINLKSDYKEVSLFLDKLSDFTLLKEKNASAMLLNQTIKQFRETIYDELMTEWYKINGMILTNHFLDNLESITSGLIGAPEKPMHTGLTTFYSERKKLVDNAEIVLEKLQFEKYTNPIFIGGLGDKGEAYLRKHIRFINKSNFDDLKSTNFKLSKVKTVLKTIVENIELLSNALKTPDVGYIVKEISKHSEMKDSEIKSLADFMCVDKYICLDKSNDIYTPSEGEKAILHIQDKLFLNDEKEVYLVDELELGLSELYIEKTILPKIKDLAKKDKVLVIATHDSNIAVRTRPSNSILKTYENNTYSTYLGNMFSRELVNITNSEDVKRWDEESAEYLEGGIKAFNERGYLYGETGE